MSLFNDLVGEELFSLIGTDMLMNVCFLYQRVHHISSIHIEIGPYLLLSPNAEFVQEFLASRRKTRKWVLEII
jgi:hypothetical protein